MTSEGEMVRLGDVLAAIQQLRARYQYSDGGDTHQSLAIAEMLGIVRSLPRTPVPTGDGERLADAAQTLLERMATGRGVGAAVIEELVSALHAYRARALLKEAGE